ncbi:MAG: VWA domain-containing protein [Saprospiraceae bacterium]|nr:VWA domain-containing protein [Saprospiraceae bacterium]
MTKDNVVNIVFVLDESGSMENIKDEAITGFNEFVRKQKEFPGEATVSLVLFSNNNRIVYDQIPLNECPELNYNTFRPNGMTALYDAIGTAVNKYIYSGRDTILAILTDGEENSSREYKYGQINNMLTHVQDELKWDVTFLGANIKNIESFTAGLGIKSGKAFAFNADTDGMNYSYNLASVSTTNARSAYAANSVDKTVAVNN